MVEGVRRPHQFRRMVSALGMRFKADPKRQPYLQRVVGQFHCSNTPETAVLISRQRAHSDKQLLAHNPRHIREVTSLFHAPPNILTLNVQIFLEI